MAFMASICINKRFIRYCCSRLFIEEEAKRAQSHFNANQSDADESFFFLSFFFVIIIFFWVVFSPRVSKSDAGDAVIDVGITSCTESIIFQWLIPIKWWLINTAKIVSLVHWPWIMDALGVAARVTSVTFPHFASMSRPLLILNISLTPLVDG